MNSIQPNRLLLGVTLLWISVSLLCYGLLYRPQQAQLSTLQSQAADKAAQLEQLQTAKAQSYQDRLTGNLDTQRQQRDAILFRRERLHELDFQLQHLVSEFQLASFSSSNLFGFAESKENKPKHIGHCKINTRFEGGYLPFLQFLNALERHEPTLFITEFGLTQGYGAQTQCVGHIEASAYYAVAN
ncbi:MAG: hypothetical protein GY809_05600 [Planctomycetes bacterium]|nr:hypothetical protein [Planctomycetota bacterium]